MGVWCSLWGFGMECDGLGEMCVEDDVWVIFFDRKKLWGGVWCVGEKLGIEV